ncbi:Conserved hypothetical protein [Bradyrhizobium sp. ORS 278]|nr:Conserved hypothetical protein [Bradyrhizobium sp. ORS 278]
MACSRELAARWRALAERRLDHLTELFDSGRWRRYYTEQSFLDDLRHAKAAVETWTSLAAAKVELAKVDPIKVDPVMVDPVKLEPIKIVPASVVSAKTAVAAPIMVAAPPVEPERLPEPIRLYALDERSFEHRPIELPRSLDTILARSEIIVEPEIALAEPDMEPDVVIEPNDVVETDYAFEYDEVAEHDVAPELTDAPLHIDMSALEQALSIGIEGDVEYDEPVVDLDAIERRYPALAVAY